MNEFHPRPATKPIFEVEPTEAPPPPLSTPTEGLVDPSPRGDAAAADMRAVVQLSPAGLGVLPTREPPESFLDRERW